MLEERVNITRMDFRPWASVRGESLAVGPCRRLGCTPG